MSSAETVPPANLAALIHTDELARFDYGDDHPFKPLRARTTIELCARYGLLDGPGVVRIAPQAAEPAYLERFHDPAYLAVLRRASGGVHDVAALARGIGTEDCPVLRGIWEFCLLATGATQACVAAVLDGTARRAFNLVGGFHHAFRGRAEGFCYVNDAGAAIEDLLARGLRVAYVDLDAHHGNGVQDAFYAEDRVLKISLHESGATLYPFGGAETELGAGRGLGFNVNVPLLERTDDEVYLETFEALVPPLLEAFRPDVVVAELGADAHVSDPLSHLRLTSGAYYRLVERLCALAPRLVGLGGGGYDVFRAARCWTLAWAAMAEREPQDGYAGLVGGMMFGSENDGLFDRPSPTTGAAKDRARAEARRVVEFHRRSVFPRLGATSP
ncbi:MAG: acetoin utilization protein AcuC [Myxococcales bacterium]|nr:acetoin utilization protein AcuC [Myxococcales bacterium]